MRVIFFFFFFFAARMKTDIMSAPGIINPVDARRQGWEGLLT